MTSSWTPKLDEVEGRPLYWRIASALVRDIRSGRLGVEERLPTHRELAQRLGVNVNTVTKAYAEAERKGLIVSRTGRGTYVKGFPEEMANRAALPQELINLRNNNASNEAFNVVFSRVLSTISRRGSLHKLFEYHPHPGLERHRAAGAHWISRRGLDATSDRVIVCNGAQEGLLAACSAITRPGDTLVTEKLNYSGLQYIAEILNLTLRGVEIDEHGVIPEALEMACERERVAAILVNPTNHNPTNAFAPVERREAIVRIAERTGLVIVEDDIFGHLTGHGAPTYAALAPDHCIYVCGTSKSIAAGLRVGYILSPAALVGQIVNRLHTMHWSSPALMSEITTQLIEGGHADEFVAWHRREAVARQRLARELLGLDSSRDLPSYHLWLPLPPGLHAAELAAEIRRQDVLVAPSDQFAVDRSPVSPAFRLSLGSVRDTARLRQGLRVIANCITRHAYPADKVG